MAMTVTVQGDSTSIRCDTAAELRIALEILRPNERRGRPRKADVQAAATVSNGDGGAADSDQHETLKVLRALRDAPEKGLISKRIRELTGVDFFVAGVAKRVRNGIRGVGLDPKRVIEVKKSGSGPRRRFPGPDLGDAVDRLEKAVTV